MNLKRRKNMYQSKKLIQEPQFKKIIRKIDFRIYREHSTERENRMLLSKGEAKVSRKVTKATTISLNSSSKTMRKAEIQTRTKSMSKKDINDL